MDPRYAEYYERELKHVRELGGEFARDFPAIAQRLSLSSFECADPYVERLLESFAFLTARIQLKMDAAFPQFTQHLLELLYPGFLAPTPSMAVVQMQPTHREGELANGIPVPRGSSLRSRLGQHQTACEYRTAQEVRLYPIELVSADYRAISSEGRDSASGQLPAAQAVLKLVLRCTGGRTFDQLRLETLPLFVRGRELAPRLYEHLVSASAGMVMRCATSGETVHISHRQTTRALGLEDEHALLPCDAQAFQGHRLLHEYFAFPERFHFVTLEDLAPGLQRCRGDRIEIQLLFSKVDRRLEGVVKESHLALFCTPVVNLFPRRSDRVPLSDVDYEHHVVPDRARPADFEVHTVTRVVGHGPPGTREQEFLPMYELAPEGRDAGAHFAVRRQPKLMSSREGQAHVRSLYVPAETFLSLVDGQHGPFRRELRQLSVDTLCTNRTLPLMMAVGRGDTDFSEQTGAPIESIRCVAGPTMPRHSQVHGELAWKLISHLGLDYMALLRDGAEHASIRELLTLYAGASDTNESAKQVQGVLGAAATNVVRPLPFPGPLTFGRGTEITLTCDESAFEGTGVFLLGSVMERFFAKYASINSFTQTVLRTSQRGEVMRWPTTAGRRNAF